MQEPILAERDALVVLGIMTRLYQAFDAPIVVPPGSNILHCRGYNVFSCVVDNADGEALVIDYNSNHADENPLQHGEQRALREAIPKIHAKRPRPVSQAPEDYYRTSIFGGTAADGLRTGCTLYNTLDPCLMCASTLLVTRMRRTAFLIEDAKFKGAWDKLKADYFANDPLDHGEVKLEKGVSPWVGQVEVMLTAMRAKAEQLRLHGIKDIHFFDHFYEEGKQASELLLKTTAADLVSTGDDLARSKRTLQSIKQICRLPA